MQTIDLIDVGPIRKLSIPVPIGGGICVLKGRNGRGKTKALEAVESALTGRGKIDVRDKALRGEVEAFGVRMTIGRSTRRSGELEVQSLDGKLSVAELVDPGIKAPEAADARRIKALVQLANVLPSAELFYHLAGGREEFEKLVGTSALAAEDLVIMAERIKRDLEAKARAVESQAEHAEGRARGAGEAAAGVDVKAEADSAVLQSALESAIRVESNLKSQLESSREAQRKARQAADALDDAEANYQGPAWEDVRDEEAAKKVGWNVSESNVKDATSAVQAAEDALRKAKADLELAKSKCDAAKSAHDSAVTARGQVERHQATLQQWRDQIEAAIPVAPTDESIADAASKVGAAREAVERGAVIRKARQHLTDAELAAQEAAGHRKRGGQLREAAKGTDDVLSRIVAQSGSQLRVEHGRLVLDTARGATYFGELSMGERWKVALDIAIEAVGRIGVLTIPQEAWESLDPINRQLLANHVAGRGVVILTAEASGDEEITAEVITAA